MAAAFSQQSNRLEEIPAETTGRIVPTLLEIERRKYKLGTDDHYRYFYLAQMLVGGTERNQLVQKKLSQMYSVFERQHGKREGLAMMIHLFKSCNDPLSTEALECLVNAPGHRAPLLFSGRRVSKEDREKFNCRNLIVHIADELEESKREDLVTLLEDQTGEDGDSKATSYRNILDLMTKACNRGILDVRDPGTKLLEWLGQLGFGADGDLTVMKEISKFDSKKQFPGSITHQTSTDSAYEEGIEEEQQFGPGPQNLPSASVESYSRDSSLFSRSRSIEETVSPSKSEMVAPKNM